MQKLLIATRGSALALWQAEFIKSALQKKYPDLEVELNILKTKGDIILDVPLAKVGGKGLFVKEIEEALLSGKADVAVHSMKDVPMVLPEGLCLGAVPKRGLSSDVYLSENFPSLDALPQNAVVGTSSLRRQSQLLTLRPDLQISMLRGNVETRLRKMKEGRYDAIILARAGIIRLGLSAKYEEDLLPPKFLPAVGQGALGIEFRSDRDDLKAFFSFMDDPDTRACVLAERAFLRRLDGGCQVPIAAHAQLDDNNLLHLEGLVADPQGKRVFRGTQAVSPEPELIERASCLLAETLLNRGADLVLRELYSAEE